MDLRAALRRRTQRVLVASAVCTAIGVRVAAQPAASDSSRVAAVDALQAEAELDLDAALRAEWDALLADPVDLDRGDLQRLRALPWIAADDIAAIAAARPFGAVDDLARLPGWSRDAVERLRPFVEVQPQRRRAPRWNANLRWSASTARARIDSGPWTLTARTDADEPTRSTGVLRLDRRRWRIALGDVRCTHGMGLLLAAAGSTARAGETAWRDGRGLAGLEGFDRSRAWRGAGLEWNIHGLQCAWLGGTHAAGRGDAIACRWRLHPAFELQCASLRLGAARSTSYGFVAGRPASRFAFEAAGAGARWAFAAAFEARRGPHRGAARLQVTPFDAPLAFGVLSAAARRAATREAHCSVATRHGVTHIECGWAATQRVEANGERRSKHEQALALETRSARTQWTLRIVRRASREESWDSAVTQRTEATIDWAWIVRARRSLRPGWIGVATLRGALQVLDAPSQSGSGRAWQVRLERDTGSLRPAFGLGAYGADSGIVLAESAPAGGFAAASLRGEGVRASLGLRVAWHGLDVHAGAWNDWRGATTRRTGWEAAFGMRLP